MSTVPNYLIPEQGGSPVLDGSALAMFNAQNVATCSALALRTQPPFSNDLLVTLPEDQALAAEHATTFQNGWGFGVAGTFLSGLSSITEFIVPMLGGGLKTVAAQLDGTSPQDPGYATQLQGFRQLIQSLIGGCCDVDPDSGSILLRMQQMRGNLAALANLIDDDDVRLHTAITEVKNAAVISKLEAQQRDLQNQFSDINAQIAKGATTTIAQDIEFGFQFSSEFIEGVTGGAVIGAALDVLGEADAIDQFEQQTKALQDQQTQLGSQIASLASTIAEDQSDAMMLTLVAAQIGVFNANIQQLLAATGSVVDQLLSWKQSLQVLADYSSPPSPGFYTNQITASLAYWTALQTALARYASIMALSTSNVAV